jgi:hypothetical protein
MSFIYFAENEMAGLARLPVEASEQLGGILRFRLNKSA